MTVAMTFSALGTALGFALVGYLLTRYITPLQSWHIPGTVIGGLLGLGLAYVPFSPLVEGGGQHWHGIFSESLYEHLGSLPAILINVVFATLMLGSKPISAKKSLSVSKANIVMGHGFAWGQHLIGALLAITVFTLMYDNSELLAPLIAIGFQGGHGTASGLQKSFEALGFAEAVDIGLGVATIGVLGGLTTGIIIFSFAKARAGRTELGSPTSYEQPESEPSKQSEDTYEQKNQSSTPAASIMSQASVQLGFIACTVGVGYLLFEVLQWIEGFIVSGPQAGLMRYIPLFPIVLIGSIMVNKVLRLTGIIKFVNRKHIEQFGAVALDMLIVSAIIALDMSTLAKYWVALALLAGCGIVFNVLLFWVVARHIYPAPWYAYALPDYGGATATTASGILLAKIADPAKKTNNLTAYTMKQPWYEPFMGGGLVTSLSLPLIAHAGIWVYLGCVTAVMAVLVGIGKKMASSKKNN